jgi:hypothetical protein
VSPSLPQEFAIERTIHRNLTFGATTGGTNIAVHTRAEAPGTAGVTNCALHFLSIEAG